MKIAVLVKQTFDTEARIELDSQGRIDETNIKKIMNPYDEYAVEEAVRLKETQGGEITVFSLGDSDAEEVLRQALAMGADQAVLLTVPPPGPEDPWRRAVLLAQAIQEQAFDLILAGWTSIDDGCAQTASRIAEILDIPQITVVTQLQVSEGQALAKRDSDEAVEVIEVKLPALITVQKGINEPRYPSFKGIMQAKKKELKILDRSSIMPSESTYYAPRIEVEFLQIPEPKAQGKILQGERTEVCRQLAQALHTLIVRQ